MVRPHHTGLVFHEFLQNGRHIRSEICIFVLGITKLRANQTLKYEACFRESLQNGRYFRPKICIFVFEIKFRTSAFPNGSYFRPKACILVLQILKFC